MWIELILMWLSNIVFSNFFKTSESPLQFANVYIQRTQEGIATEEDGSFQLRVAATPNDTLVISYVGYASMKVVASGFQRQPCQTIALGNFEFADDFIVIKEYGS